MSQTTNFKSEIVIQESFPHAAFAPEKDLLIVDEKLAARFSNWSYVYSVKGGEELKDLRNFPTHVEKILALWKQPISRQSRVVAVGGGSVGDFAGFFASVLKRGVVFEQCPSTWLSAIDSAHGGKTALNAVDGNNQIGKNQIGTFYPAKRVFLVREILASQPEARAMEGLGELFKAALLDKKLYANLQSGGFSDATHTLWKNLETAIAVKYNIVLEDPYETKGLRKFLNLGHTMGHVLESAHGIPHGESVMQGLFFAIEWSHQRGYLSKASLESAKGVMQRMGFKAGPASATFKPVSAQQTLALVMQDKKMTADARIDFVFLRDIGEPAVYPVSTEEILMEAFRQGWAK